MIAKQLEALLSSETSKTDLSYRSSADLVQRFQSLRGFRLLPKGRGKNAQHLNLKETVAGILSIASDKPGYAGTASKLLMNLKPVGGVGASFQGASTFGDAVARLLEDEEYLNSVLEVRFSVSEIYTNGHGRAAIVYHADSGPRVSYYVGSTATSLLGKGAEKTYDPNELISSAIKETVLFPKLFMTILRTRRINYPEHAFDHLVDPDEEEIEHRKDQRVKELGITQASNFLNMPVDTQVTWPDVETVVDFEGKRLVLMPRTRDTDTSIHIDLHGNKLSPSEAHTLANRFLSLMTWCDDQFCTLQDGSYGSHFPVAMNKRDLAFATAHHWIFDRKLPKSQEARTALALYRQGRNAEQNYLVPYAILSYVKVIEVRYGDKGEPQKWIEENYEPFKEQMELRAEVLAFEDACAETGEKPHRYIWKACRVAVSHVSKRAPSDPDEFDELRRLHAAANVVRGLARYFIKHELNLSDHPFDGT